MESQAEELVDTLLAKKSAESFALYTGLSENMNLLHSQVSGQQFDERLSREMIMAYSWMRLISIDLNHSAWVGAAIDSNQLIGEIIRFTEYSNPTLRDVAWMDYMGREVLLLTMESPLKNAAMIDLRKQDLNVIWQRVRRTLITRDFKNKPVVLKGDTLLSDLISAKRSEEISRLVNDELEFVDEIEKIIATAGH